MRECIHAYTKPTSEYPGYINVSRDEDGTIVLTVRGDPSVFDGVYICGYAHEKGQPGRCTPGDDRCNNYCNMAPAKGPMQDHPLPCRQVTCGESVTLRLTGVEFRELLQNLSSR